MIKAILVISFAVLFAVSAAALPFGTVDAAGSFLEVKKAKVVTDSTENEKVKIPTKGHIPTDGSGGAFGYGVISGAGLTAIQVTTTHQGVLDSEVQSDANDAVFHNHYVSLHEVTPAGDEADLCPGLEVKDISFQAPGDVEIDGKKAVMEDVPYYFAGTHSLDSSSSVSFLADGDIQAVVSFTINPVDATGTTSATDIHAVCINDVTPSKNLIIKERND